MRDRPTFRLEVEGDSASARIIDEQTGEDVTTRLGAASITLTLRPGQRPLMRVDAFVQAKATGVPAPEWYAKDPRTGRSARLATLTFADGYVANLLGTPDEPPGNPESACAEPD